jgi:broad specificity phosphatase PhoE
MAMPKNLILIRHGYSEANELQSCNNRLIEESVTIPDRAWRLTDKGIQQAKAIGTIFTDGRLSQIDSFFVSPYRRTIETAGHMNISKANWKLMRSIRERSWGDIDTLPKKIFKDEYPRNYSQHVHDPIYWTPPSGESIAGVAENRVANMLTTLHREHAGENVVLVTHHDFIQSTRLVLENMTDEEFMNKVNDGTLDVPNGSALWYSRVDPFNGNLNKDISHYRVIVPVLENDQWVIKRGKWQPITQPTYTNDELLHWD